LKPKRLILVASLICLALVSCGKKGNPIPKGLPIPAGIGDLRGDVKDGVLFISFSIPARNMDGTDIKDLVGFRILKSCGGCGGGFEVWRNIALTDKQGYTIRSNRLYTYDDDLRQGFDYAYKVYAYTGKNVEGGVSNVFSIKWRKPPPPPKEVATTPEDARVFLSWEKEDDLSYNVYRPEKDVYPLFPVNLTPLTASQFTDANLQNGQQYRYEVRAIRVENGVPYEGEGTTVLATPEKQTPPAPPGGLQLEKKDRTVVLAWAASTESDVTGYNVYRVFRGKAEKINADILKEPRFVDNNLGREPYLTYYVTAVDDKGRESLPSKEEFVILTE
jgi:hypothetical protein